MLIIKKISEYKFSSEKIKLILIGLIPLTFFSYFNIFQVKYVISRTYLVLSLMSALALCFGLFLLFLLTPTFQSSNIKKNLWQNLFFGVFLTAVFISISGITQNFLLAPKIELSGQFFSSRETKTQVLLKQFYSGLQYESYSSIKFSASQIENDSLKILPDLTGLTAFYWGGRAWGAVELVFAVPEYPTKLRLYLDDQEVDFMSPQKRSGQEWVINVPIQDFLPVEIFSIISVVIVDVFSFFWLLVCLTSMGYFQQWKKQPRILTQFVLPILATFYIASVTYITFIGINPISQKIGLDSGVFLYMGREMLTGKIPYKDLWDHKGPLLYGINALGVSITNNSWGIWFVEMLFFAISGILIFILFRKKSAFIAFCATLFTFAYFFRYVVNGGNYPEEYVLLFMMSAIVLFDEYLENNKIRFYKFFGIGIMAGLSFMLKPNLVSVFLAIGLYFILNEILNKRYFKLNWGLFYFLGGGLIVISFGFAFFYYIGAIPDFLQAYFLYNFIYSQNLAISYFEKIIKVFKLLPIASISLFFALFSFSMIIYAKKVLNRKNLMIDPHCVVLFLALVIEILLSNFSGYGYIYYFLPLTLLSSLNIGYSIISSKDLLLIIKKNYSKISDYSLYGGLILLLFLTISFIVRSLRIHPNLNTYRNPFYSEISDYLGKDQYVLFWDSEARINFAINKKIPTKFLYLSPVFNCKFVTNEMIHSFVEDLKITKPIIVDKHVLPFKTEFPADIRNQDNFSHCDQLWYLFDFLDKTYIVDTTFSNGWVAYRYE